MPRQSKPTTPQVSVDLNHEAIGKAVKARDELTLIDQQAEANTTELAKFLGYDGPLQPELLAHGIAQQMRRTVDACLETGKMLLLLKERVGHGGFTEWLGHLGLEPRAAQRFMQAAYKFSNASTSTHLTKAIGSQSKLIELLVLDSDDIQELADGGSAAGLTIDSIASMSVSELRAALREAREDTAAKDKLLEEKNKKIDKLLAGKKFKPSEGSIAQTAQQQAQLDELHEATARAEVVFMALATVVADIETSDSKAMRGRAAQAVQYLVQRIADVVDEHGIEVDLSQHIAVRPDWLQPLAGEGATTVN